MPVCGLDQFRRLPVHGDDGQAEPVGASLREASGHERDQRGAGHRERQREQPGDHDRLLGLDAEAQQRPFSGRGRAAAEVDDGVAHRRHLIQRDRVPGGARVAAVGDAHEPVPEHHLPAAGDAQPGTADQQVPALQVGLVLLGIPGQRVDLHAHERGPAAEQLEQRGQQHGHRVVGDRDRDLAPAGRRVEVRRHLERDLGLADGLLHQRQRPLGQRGQHVPPARAHQQLVVEVLAQPGQGRTHGRLAHADPLASVGQVPLFEQRTEDHQQVQVSAAKPGHTAPPRHGRRSGEHIGNSPATTWSPGLNRWDHARGGGAA